MVFIGVDCNCPQRAEILEYMQPFLKTPTTAYFNSSNSKYNINTNMGENWIFHK